MGQKRWHGIDDIARDTQDFLDAIHHDPDRHALAKRMTTTLFASDISIAGRPNMCPKAYQRQQPVAQRDNAQNMSMAVRQLGDLVGELDDFLDALDRERIFLIRHFETDKVVFIQSRLPRDDLRSSRPSCAPCASRSAAF